MNKLVCHNCGHELDPAQQFCMQCGVQMAQTSSAPSPTVARSIPTSTVPPIVTQVRKQRSVSLRVVAIGIIALLVLAGTSIAVSRIGFFGRSGVDRVALLTTKGNRITLELMNSDGSQKTTLVDVPEATSTSARISVHPMSNRQSKSLTVLVRAFANTNSPGGVGAYLLASQRRVLFWYPTDAGKVIEIRSVDLDGNDSVILARTPGSADLYIAESGDRFLLVEHHSEGARVGTADLRSHATTLADGITDAGGTLSADGQHLAYWTKNKDSTYTLNLADGSGANASIVAQGLQSVSAIFASDGSKLFISTSTNQNSQIQVVDTNGGNQVSLSYSGQIQQADVVNGRLVFSINESGETSLFTSSLSGEDKAEIVRAANMLVWIVTPDQRQLVVTQQRNGSSSLFVTDMKRDQVVELDRGDGTILPEILANGRILVWHFSSNNGIDGDVTISTMQFDGSDKQAITQNINAAFSLFDITQNDLLLPYTTGGDSRLALFTAKNTVLLDEGASSYRFARLTPGDQVLFTAQFKSGPVTYIVGRDGKNRRLLAEDAQVIATGF